MKNRVVQGLLKSDIYGYPVTLNFKKNTKYRTVLGGVLSLITIATIVVLAYNSAISLINRENDYVQRISIILAIAANYCVVLPSPAGNLVFRFYFFSTSCL
jgi:hypothetical protein